MTHVESEAKKLYEYTVCLYCTVPQGHPPRVVIPTPPQANEVKMSVFATLEDPWLEIRLFEWDLLRLELSRMMAC